MKTTITASPLLEGKSKRSRLSFVTAALLAALLFVGSPALAFVGLAALSGDGDTDGDGVPDVDDLDDDNDGILDSVEFANQELLVNAGFEQYDAADAATVWDNNGDRSMAIPEGDFVGWNSTDVHDMVELWESGHNGIASHSGAAHAEISAFSPASLFQDVVVPPGAVLEWSLAHRGRTDVDNAVVRMGAPDAMTTELAISTGTAWTEYSGTYTVPADTPLVRLEVASTEMDTDRGNMLDSVSVKLQDLDTDGDGQVDARDLDSDDDGSPDIVEHGDAAVAALDTNGNGLIDSGDDGGFVDADNDGLDDRVEAIHGEDTGVTPVDSDGDQQYDTMDSTVSAPQPAPEPANENGSDPTSYQFEDAGLGEGATCEATTDEDRLTRATITADQVTEPTVAYSTGFSANENMFTILSGAWTFQDGTLQQVNTCGFDYTTLLQTAALENYRLEVAMSGIDGINQGGVVIGQSSIETRSGAVLVDLADGGATLRWGSYDAGDGRYANIGSTSITAPAPGQAVNLEVEAVDGTVTVTMDGQLMATFAHPHTTGHVGLVSSISSVAFDDLTLTALPAGG